MTGLITLEKELMDDRVSSVRTPRARVRKDTAPLVRGDGASAFDHYPAAERNYRQSYFAREKIGESPGKYPFISGEYAKNIWKVPVLWGLSKIFGYARDSTEGHPNTATQFFNAAFSLFYSWSNQLYETHFRSSLPKIAAWNGFLRGQSDLPRMYTIEVGEYEMPIFIYNTNPDRLIRDNFEIDRDGNVTSKFNRAIGKTRKGSWLLVAADKYTRGDYRGLIDAPKAESWFVKDYTWDMQQFGSVTTTTVGPFTVKRYKRPSTMGTFLRNLVCDKVYDFVDTPFDMLGRAGFGKIAKVTQQDFKDREYKTIAKLRRSIFQSPRKNLTYDRPLNYVDTNAHEMYTRLTT